MLIYRRAANKRRKMKNLGKSRSTETEEDDDDADEGEKNEHADVWEINDNQYSISETTLADSHPKGLKFKCYCMIKSL